MNPTEEQLPPPPQPPQPSRNSTSCDRHPDEHFTGFCPSCLCERLVTLDQSSSASTASGRKSASSTFKSIFRVSANPTANGNNANVAANGTAFRNNKQNGSFFPELRRTKSFSGRKNDGFGFSGIFEPQRKSCDVRVRNTLWSLFNQDDEKRTVVVAPNNENINGSCCNNLGQASSSSSYLPHPLNPPATAKTVVVELKEEEEEEEDDLQLEFDGDGVKEEAMVDSDEIQEVEEPVASNSSNCIYSGEQQQGQGVGISDELKPMKDHIDLDSQNKKVGTKDLKELAGSFWSAASVFSKKLKAWAKKHPKMVKKHNGPHAIQEQESKRSRSSGRSRKSNGYQTKNYHYRDTQSEIADYGFGRRSCDTDPRFSLDVGRMSLDVGRMSLDAGRTSLDAGRTSFDDPRYSFDEPRASWDGYLIGRSFPRMAPMVSVVEDPPVIVPRKDNQIPVEEQPRSSISLNGELEEEGSVPGGATQTKDYYSDSSSRRRKSLDRSSSIRKAAAAVVAEMDEMKTSMSNGAKVSPATGDSFHGAKLVAGDRELRDLNCNSHRENGSESFEIGFRDNASVTHGNGERKEAKKSRGWRAWNIWGLIYRRGGSNKDEDEDRYSRPNGVERSLSESWQELRRGEGYGVDARGAFNRHVFRSNSSVSWRNSYNIGGSFASTGKRGGSFETNGLTRKKKDEFVLERNRSARYSPNHADNGLLRFYLTPMRGSRRGGSVKAKPTYSHSIARSVLRMY
ncbi:hypothetical protein Ancab_032200 [Ancistrocladus abbreviatus]